MPGALAAVSRLAGVTGLVSPGSRVARVTVEPWRPARCPTCCQVAALSPTPPRGSTWPPHGASSNLPEAAGRDGNAIVAAAAAGELGGLVVGGVDPADLDDPALARSAVEAAGFVVSLEVRASEVTRAADVVFPVAPVTDRPARS